MQCCSMECSVVQDSAVHCSAVQYSKPTVHTELCTMCARCRLQCTVYSVQFQWLGSKEINWLVAQFPPKSWLGICKITTVETLYCVHCTLYYLHCVLHTALFTLCTAHCTIYTVNCAVLAINSLEFAQHSVNSIQCPLHIVHSLKCTLYTLHWDSVYYKLNTTPYNTNIMYSVYCTPFILSRAQGTL